MKIVRGGYFDIAKLKEIDSVLLYFSGAYYYVESGIIENELRVLKNWRTAERPVTSLWHITYKQGVQIPQELGDYLVRIQNLKLRPHKIGAWLSAAFDDDNVCEEMKKDIRDWFDTLPPYQDNDQTSDSSE